MPTITNPLDLLFQSLFFETKGLIETGRLVVKLEGYNVTGSIKIKSALFMINDLERRGGAGPHPATILESSPRKTGNRPPPHFGLRGYGLLCVSAPKLSLGT